MVADTPEERVRQSLLRKMVNELGYPLGLISVERSIGGRRTDVVCYSPCMKPLLLIECKAQSLSEKAIQQALGYNTKIQAPFISLSYGNEIMTFWFEGDLRKSVPFLPKFLELVNAI